MTTFALFHVYQVLHLLGERHPTEFRWACAAGSAAEAIQTVQDHEEGAPVGSWRAEMLGVPFISLGNRPVKKETPR